MAELAQFADTVRRLATPATTRHCQGYVIQQSEYWCTSSVGHRRSCSRTMTRRSAVMRLSSLRSDGDSGFVLGVPMSLPRMVLPRDLTDQ